MAKDYSIGYKFKGDSSGFQRATEDIKKSISGVASTVKTMAGGFLTLGAVIETTKLAMKSTEGSADTLDRMMGALQGTVQGLFRTIVTGDWAALISNITKTAEATRNLKWAMDDLEDITASNALKKSNLRRSLEDARVAVAATSDPAERSKLLNEAIEYQKAITAIDVSEQQKRIRIKYDYYKQLSSQDEKYWEYLEGMIPKFAANWEYFGSASFKAGVDARKGSLQYLESIGAMTTAQAEELRTLKLTTYALEDYQKIKDDMSKPGEFNEFINSLATLNDIYAEGDQSLRRMVQSLTTAQDKLEKIDKASRDKGVGFAKVNMPGSFQQWGAEQNKTTGTLAGAPIVKVTEALQEQSEVVNELNGAFANMFMSTKQGFEGMIDSLIDGLKRWLAELAAKALTAGLLNLIMPGTGTAANALTGLRQFTGIAGASRSGIGTLQSNVNVIGKLSGRDIYLSASRYGEMLGGNT